ncbi:unnamed protein product [Prunus armeniaca]|uniref:Uncharacterized protein n=1 Tax=Prunus armeniaca TaxID=36596 RepID=A0A6J5UIX1_PRUAR|nr:unnamed protein product [Prunus armeniaca]CAB4306414.1 unnamed protein product [Prunus armeniaca]
MEIAQVTGLTGERAMQLRLGGGGTVRTTLGGTSGIKLNTHKGGATLMRDSQLQHSDMDS